MEGYGVSRRSIPRHRGSPAMPLTPCGYAVGTGIFTPAELHQLQTSITETINRLARGFLTPYATSCPELPLSCSLCA